MVSTGYFDIAELVHLPVLTSHYGESLNMVSTGYFDMAELVHLPVLTYHYGESLYKTCPYGEFLNLYGGRQANSILTTGITVPNLH